MTAVSPNFLKPCRGLATACRQTDPRWRLRANPCGACSVSGFCGRSRPSADPSAPALPAAAARERREAMMLYHLNTRAEQPEGLVSKTWLVIAGNAAEAISLLPADQVVTSVEIHAPCSPGAARLLGWMGPPPAGGG